MRPIVLLAALAPAIAAAGPVALQHRLKVGASARYRVAATITEFGADGKQTTKVANETPILLTRQSATQVRTEIGPLFTLGRSVGRSKVKESAWTGVDRAPVPLYVVLPAAGVKVGQKWEAPFAGIAPIPAGLTAQYCYVKATADGRFAEVSLSLARPGATRLRGTGRLFVRLSDGVLDHGTAKVSIDYLRPKQDDRTKMVVNSSLVVDLKIK